MRNQQMGSSLIELLVGIAIGLMVIAAATGTLVLSRVTSLAATDQLELQQQANTAMRIITSHLREANTRELEFTGLPGAANQPVQLSPLPTFTGSTLYVQGFARDANNNDDFGVAYADAAAPRVLDCQGNTNQANGGVFVPGMVVTNRFSVINNELMCLGVNAGPGAQAIASDVQRLRVLYAFQDTAAVPPTITYTTQATAPGWVLQDLVGMEICLELATPARGSSPVVGNYTDCDGNVMAFDQRVRAIVRQTVRLRSLQTVL